VLCASGTLPILAFFLAIAKNSQHIKKAFLYSLSGDVLVRNKTLYIKSAKPINLFVAFFVGGADNLLLKGAFKKGHSFICFVVSFVSAYGFLFYFWL
jgi:hypothetical protein